MKLFNKKIFGSGNTTLIISNEEMNDIMERIKPYKESGLLKKFFKENLIFVIILKKIYLNSTQAIVKFTS